MYTVFHQAKRSHILKTLLLVCVFAIVLIGIFSLVSTHSSSITSTGIYRLVQDETPNPDVAVMPANLGRLSWGAVLAGALIALVIQLGLNMLGLALGMTTINPQYGEDSASPKALAMGSIIWVILSALVALFVGGWVASRFAGIPEDVDGILHGVTTWAVVTLITAFLLTTAIGKIIGGASTLIGQGLTLAGRATDVAVRGAAGAANVAAQGVATAASGVAQAAGSAASGVANAAQNVASNAGDAAKRTVNNTPELSEALQQQSLSREKIQEEARKLLEQAGIQPQFIKDEFKVAAGEVGTAVSEATQQSPKQALQTMSAALDRVFQHGESVVGQVSDVDRQAVVDVMMQRGNLNEADARAKLDEWERNFKQTKTQAEQVSKQMGEKADQLKAQAQQTVDRVKEDVQQKVEQVRDDAEKMMRDAAEATTKAISQIAAAVFAAIVIGGLAAGLGGLLGTPDELPTVKIDTDGVSESYNMPDAMPIHFVVD